MQPAESSIRVLLRIHRHINVRGTKLRHHRVEIAYAEIDHPLLFCPAEVIGIQRKRRKNCRACLLIPRLLIIAFRRQLDSKMILVPLGQKPRILRSKKIPPTPVTRSIDLIEANAIPTSSVEEARRVDAPMPP